MLRFGYQSRGDETLIDFLLGYVFETAATFFGSQRALALDRQLSLINLGQQKKSVNERGRSAKSFTLTFGLPPPLLSVASRFNASGISACNRGWPCLSGQE